MAELELDVEIDVGVEAEIEIEAEVEVEAEIEVEVEMEAPVIECELEVEVEGEVEFEAPVIEIEIEAPVVEIECDVEIDCQVDMENDLEAPIVEIEAGGSGAVASQDSRKTCCCLSWGIVFLIFFISSLIYSILLLTNVLNGYDKNTLSWYSAVIIDPLVWLMVFGICMGCYCCSKKQDAQNQGLIIYADDAEVGGGANVELTANVDAQVEIEFEAPCVDIEIENDAPNVEVEIEFEAPVIEIEAEVE